MASKRKATSKTASKDTKKPKKLENQAVRNQVVENQVVEEVVEVEEVEEELLEVDETDSVEDSTIVNSSEEGEEEEKVVEVVDWAFKPRICLKTSKNGKVDGGIENVGGGNVKGEEEEGEGECELFGAPVLDSEARSRWGHRYVNKKIKQKVGEEKSAKSNDEEDDLVPARRHFTQAKVDGDIYNLHDDAYVMADGDEDNYICKIVEFFESEDGSPHFTAQWFYRAKDTVIEEWGNLVDEKCIFLSDVKNDNPLNCLLKKLNIVKVPPKVDSDYKEKVRTTCDYYYEMMYLLPYSSFVSMPNDGPTQVNGTNLSVSTVSDESTEIPEAASSASGDKADLILMDIYSGCGAMSTGLCLGASRGGVKLTTKWAIDINQYACSSLRLNHPETEVRNEPAENFLSLMEEWYRLCVSYSLVSGSSLDQHVGPVANEDSEVSGGEDNNDEDEEDDSNDDEVYEVEEILEICYGDPKENNETGLHFKIKWKNYGPEFDTWEPRDCLSGCPEKLKEFVVKGFKSKLLPLPGDVDVICGGPPCQGISGYNRFRNAAAPLEDEKNKQLKVFMDIVYFLKPKYVLMENVVDIIKFADASLGKYAIGRLVSMGYQTRMGLMAAGSYGLPQFRMRVFLWGGLSTENLPQYALPTHKVVNRGVVPQKYEANKVAYEQGHSAMLKNELTLLDALSDLPPVENNESRDEMPYNMEPKTDFQRFIRLKKDAMLGSCSENSERWNEVLYDHCPLELNIDDYQRVCEIPRKKGANFRDLKGVCVGTDNKVFFDPNISRVLLPSGKPLVPEYAMTFVKGTSSKPFRRLWWDETVPTVTTRAEPHNHANLHPEQDRVLTVRESARLQGFPDFYKFMGPIKQRYMQVGNAVAVPVARALGYCLAMAYKGDVDDRQPLLILPNNFLNDE